MALKEKISTNALKLAMVKKDKVRLNVLRTIKSELSRSSDKEFNDQDIIKVVKKLSQSVKEVKSDDWEKEVEILDEFIPKQLTEEEMKTHVISLINNGFDNIGKIMGYMNKNFSGMVDNKTLSAIIKEKLKK